MKKYTYKEEFHGTEQTVLLEIMLTMNYESKTTEKEGGFTDGLKTTIHYHKIEVFVDGTMCHKVPKINSERDAIRLVKQTKETYEKVAKQKADTKPEKTFHVELLELGFVE